MTTTVTKTVKSSGGDYSSISAWHTGQVGDNVSRDTIQEAQLFSYHDTTPVSFSGWTTDATRYCRIFTDATARHAGYWDTSKFYFTSTNSDGLTNPANSGKHWRFEGLQMELINNNLLDVYSCLHLLGRSGSDQRVGRCIFNGTGTTGNSAADVAVKCDDSSDGTGVVTAYNCIVSNFYDQGFPTGADESGFNCPFGSMFCRLTVSVECICTYMSLALCRSLDATP